MTSEEYKEILREGKFVVYSNGKYAEVREIGTNKLITSYNIKIEDFKRKLRKTAVTLCLSTILLSPFFFSGFKRGEKNLEYIVQNANTEIKNQTEFSNQEKEKFPFYIDEAFVKATIYVESSNNPYTVSKAGALGLPQTYFETWKEVFQNDSYQDFIKGIRDEKKSSEFILKYYSLLDSFMRENWDLYKELDNNTKRIYLAAAYNCGPERLRKLNFALSKAPKETQYHVKKIKEVYKKLI